MDELEKGQAIVLILGNVVDGLGFYGPFDNHDEANEAGELSRDEWVTAIIEKPEWL